MAAVDPYASCPCGSGQKFKWCCQKMESYADRAERLAETGQIAAAIGVLDDGLSKEPANAWLLIRKALIQMQQGSADDAATTLRELMARRPQHLGAHLLLTRATLESRGPAAGLAQLQHAASSVADADRPALASMYMVVASLLHDVGSDQAAMAHLRVSAALGGDSPLRQRIESIGDAIMGDPRSSPWVRSQYKLAPVPAGLDAGSAARFAEALALAESGRWAAAETAFELLCAVVKGPEAELNLGLCRLWLLDDAAGVESIRRAVRRMGPTEQAVDLEALCQIVDPPREDELIDRVQLLWPLRNREALLAALKAQADVVADESGPIDPNDDESPAVDRFILLDRAEIPPGRDPSLGPITAAEMPRIVGAVFVGREIAGLEGYDDASLKAATARLTALAGAAIPPAHPKMKVISKVSKASMALVWEWYPPEDVDPDHYRRLTLTEQARLIHDVWPGTKMPYLAGRTPRQAAAAGDAVVPLRAALRQFEVSLAGTDSPLDLAALRASLGVEPEPEIDAATVDVTTLNFSRFDLVRVEALSDAKLVDYFEIARAAALDGPVHAAGAEIVRRPSLFASQAVDPITVYSILANEAVRESGLPAGLALIEQGRAATVPAERAGSAPAWDMIEVALRTRAQPPEAWVPELAVVLDRYRDNQSANQLIMLNLVELGLIRVVPNPDDRTQMLLDPRVLQSFMSKYGPRVTTASGQLGVSATKGAIWTPESASGGQPGAIWTPGSTPPPAPGGDKPKLILGR